MAVVSAVRGGRWPLFQRHRQISSSSSTMGSWGSLRSRRHRSFRPNSKRFALFARYSQSQSQDLFSSRLQGEILHSQIISNLFLFLFFYFILNICSHLEVVLGGILV